MIRSDYPRYQLPSQFCVHCWNVLLGALLSGRHLWRTAALQSLRVSFQAANGSTPLEAGIKMLPYSLGSSLASMPPTWFIGWWQERNNNTGGQIIVIKMGLLFSTTGFGEDQPVDRPPYALMPRAGIGMLHLLHEQSSLAEQVAFPLIAGIGIGMLFHTPFQVFTKALKPYEIAPATSAFFLVRFTGATAGLVSATDLQSPALVLSSMMAI